MRLFTNRFTPSKCVRKKNVTWIWCFIILLFVSLQGQNRTPALGSRDPWNWPCALTARAPHSLRSVLRASEILHDVYMKVLLSLQETCKAENDFSIT